MKSFKLSKKQKADIERCITPTAKEVSYICNDIESIVEFLVDEYWWQGYRHAQKDAEKELKSQIKAAIANTDLYKKGFEDGYRKKNDEVRKLLNPEK